MDYEKMYKKALEIAKSKISNVDRKDRLYYVDDIEEIFPELKESEDEKIRNDILYFLEEQRKAGGLNRPDWIAWLEKQGDKKSSKSMILWHDVSEEPQEMHELLCEWKSEDAVWHDVAFYHTDTKTFWNGSSQIIDVTKWARIDDISWLKTLRPYKQWKPSEEQMTILQYLVENSSHPNPNIIPILESLYEQLKAL